MPIKKYINTTEAAELTGHPYNEILNLAKTGVLPSHKTRRGHYRLKVEAVEEYFGIQINKPTEVVEKPVPKVKPRIAKEFAAKPAPEGYQTTPVGTQLIANESHYQDVIERICAAKTSIRIMTANFKRFNLKPTDKQGNHYNDGTPFIKYLMAKAVQGVSVQILCSRPSPSFTGEWQEYYRQMNNPILFEYKFCERNHAKVVVIDDKIAYIGSANAKCAKKNCPFTNLFLYLRAESGGRNLWKRRKWYKVIII